LRDLDLPDPAGKMARDRWIDIVVVYKVERLTRSFADFASRRSSIAACSRQFSKGSPNNATSIMRPGSEALLMGRIFDDRGDSHDPPATVARALRGNATTCRAP
jgi:hypothetical protein